MDFSMVLYFSTLLIFITISPSSNFCLAQRPFSCSPASATCNALIDYVPPNATTLSGLGALFTIKDLPSILGANNLPINTPSNHTVPANQSVKIPFPCICSNGTGVSKQLPNYTVVPGDGLFHIAAEVFSGLVTYQQIQAANGIPDPNKINVGQKLHIPLPCSCDEVDGKPVVHYGHVVEARSTLEGIAQKYNTSQETLMRLNNLTGPEGLLAGAVLDVPLRACSSMISNRSLDYPLLVSNGTYVFTANNCIRCQCDASRNWKLQCDPNSQNHSSNCSPPPCRVEDGKNLNLGNTTSGCNRTTCAYAGFNNQSGILTQLDSESTCPVSSASTLRRGWNEVVIFVHGLLLCVSLLMWM